MSDIKTVQEVNTEINNHIDDLIYEDHEKDIRFARGKLLGIQVIIDKKTRYICGPDLAREAFKYEVQRCKALGTEYKRKSPKRYNDWMNKTTKGRLESISGVTRILVTLLTVEHENVDGELQGIYMHPLVAVEYIRWLSPNFADYANRIVLEYGAQESRIEKIRLKQDLQEEKKKVLSLEEKMERMKLEINEHITRTAQEVTFKVKQEANIVINEVQDKLDDAVEEIITVRQTVQELLPPLITPKTKDVKGTEMCIILKKKDPNAEYKYYIICAYINTALSKSKRLRGDKDEYMREIYSTSSPNSKNLFRRIKEDEYLIGSKVDRRRRNAVLNEIKKIEYYVNDIKLIDGVINEDQFIEAVKRLDGVKEDICKDI